MKKTVFKVVLATTSILVSMNQVEAQKGLQLGLEVNPQTSYLLNKDDMDSKYYDGKNAFNGHFGLSGQYGISEKIGVGLNVLYSFQGDKYNWKDQERLKSLQYVKIPLMLTVTLPIGGQMSFIGKVGPQISFLTDARLYDKDRNSIKDNYKKAFVSTDFGGMISAGVSYQLNDQFSMDASLRGDIGFVNAEDKDFKQNIHDPFDLVTPSPASSPRGSAYNMTAGLNIGVRYKL